MVVAVCSVNAVAVVRVCKVNALAALVVASEMVAVVRW